jgi:two-component system cell cycle sensor histidine kinase/response regulator CckA
MFIADALLKAISQAVIATDGRGRIVFSNPAADELYGGAASKIVGRNLAAIMPDHNVSELFTAVRGKGSWSGGRRSPDDDSLSFITACALRDANGAIEGFVIVSTPLDSLDLPRVVDESERLRLENRLLQAERISSLGRLAASVAHEFNNVLMGIQPFIDLLTKRSGDDPTVKLAAPRIADAVARGKRITQEILRFTRIGEPTRVPVNVAEWLHAFEPELVQLAGPLVTVTTASEASLVMLADAHQLRQVFANLVVNAHHAMPNGGRLEVRANRDAMSNGDAGPIPAVHFSICDTGVGIPEDTLLYIFEPLFTTKKFGGTGLGLAVASQVVQQHHGHIYAESTLGEGTTFHILIPASPTASIAAAPVQQTTSTRVRPPMRVTMIEDDESVGAGLVAVLDFEGISTDWVRLGADAVSRIAARFPDAVILDLGLPDLDGMQVYEQIAARWPDLPVLFSTGHGDRDLLTPPNGKKVGYLQKPYESDELLAALDELLG